MMARARFVLSPVVILFAGSFAVAQPAIAPPPHPPLTEVVKEYKRLGLPFPPQNAQLVRINRDRYTENFHQEGKPATERYFLAYRFPPAEPGGQPRYMVVGLAGLGLSEWEYVEPAAVEETKPTPNLLELVSYAYGHHLLALAVQCKDRGWDDLARVAYARALERLTEDESYRSVISELFTMAWYHQQEPITTPGGDRKGALRWLKALAAEDQSLHTERNDWLLRSLELTVAPRKSKPGSVEALIDDLVEYHVDDNSIGPFTNVPSEAQPPCYWKLAELGFDAVPALIAHLSDDRLTRTWDHGVQFSSSYHLTVGHLCSRLLYDLSARTIGGGYWELRGDRLDPNEAKKWFEKAKKIGEEKWLIDHAIPADGGKHIVNEKGRPEPHIVRIIGAKYPARLPAIYRAMLKKPVEESLINDFVYEVVESKLPPKQKRALLEEGTVHDDLKHQFLALRGIARIDQTSFRKHLLVTLKRIESQGRMANPDGSMLCHLVERADDRACWDAFAATGKAVDVGLRMDLIREIIPFAPPNQKDPHRLERIRFLMQFLDDRSADVDEEGTRIDIRDYAASQLTGLLGFVVKRMPDPGYQPVHDPTLSPIARLLLRGTVRQAAIRELAAKK